MNKLKLSIIMPCYNAERYLKFAVESVLAQTFQDFELILVDDGSKDRTGELCDLFLKKDKRIVVIHQENKGIGGARNAGLEIAKGEYVGFMDNDDLIHPQMFEILIVLAEKEDADIVMFRPALVPQDWEIPRVRYNIFQIPYHQISKTYLYENMFAKSNEDTPFVTIWNKLWRKNILESNMFPLYGSEDSVFNCKAYASAKKAIMIDIEPDLYYWIQRKNSTCHSGFTMYHCMCLQSYFDMEEFVFYNVPESHYLAADKTYRKVLSFRYNSKGSELEKQVRNIIFENIKSFQKRFLKQKNISIKNKIAYSVFYYIPLFYNVFRSINEKKVQIRKNGND